MSDGEACGWCKQTQAILKEHNDDVIIVFAWHAAIYASQGWLVQYFHISCVNRWDISVKLKNSLGRFFFELMHVVRFPDQFGLISYLAP